MIKKIWFALLACVVFAVPALASTYGPLANFDVVNDTGSTAHGFEIDIDGIAQSDITSLFGAANRWPGMERYGSPVVSTTPTGVKIVYEATYNGSWSAGTPSGTLPVSPSDSCWPLGAPNYGPNYPCDHFGVSTTVNTPNVTYKWLVESSPGSSTLTPVLATVPNPVWTVGVPVVINNVPQAPPVNVVIVAPQPQGAYEFGEPRWVKVTATGVMQDIAVEDLVAENAIIKQAQTQVQMEWQLLQVDSGSPGSGQIDLTGVALDPGATGVVYRFEFYKYTGQRDPATNEALVGPNGDTPGANGPSAGDLGAFIVAQNAGINFDGKIPPAPPLPIAPTLNATIQGAQYGLPYSQAINATPGNPGDALTFSVTGLPPGLTLTGNTISGTPTSIGTFPLVITVTDTTNSTSTSGSTNLVVADSPMVFPNPFTFAPATVGTPYSQTITVTGGLAPYTFADVYNRLAAVGLSIVGNAITGTPTTAGTPSVTIQATDHLGYTQSATATLVVTAAGGPPPPVACSATNKVITSVSLTSIDIGGGKGNPGGQTATLPASINYIAPANSLVNGELETFTGTLDQQGNCAAASLTVAPGLSLGSPNGLPAGQVGVAYTRTPVAAAGGVGPFTVSVSGLPKSLSFDGTAISGTPSLGMNGVYTIVISISDSVGESVHTNFTLTVAAPPAIVLGSINLPATGYTGAAYTGSATASGGIGTLAWSATGLPTGVSISSTGVISGTPLGTGVFNVTLSVQDNLGQIATFNQTVTIGTASTLPTFNPPGGSYTSVQLVTISDAVAGAKIYYTLDGSTPTTSSQVYSVPIYIGGTFTVKAIAVGPGNQNSPLATAKYKVTLPSAAAPTFTPAPGKYTGSVVVTISDTTANAIIHYTLDGSTPLSSSPVYVGPLTLTHSTVVKAIATAANFWKSSVASAAYSVVAQVPTPVISPGSGAYAKGQLISISDAIGTATIRYTTDGSIPTTHSTMYTHPFALTGNETVQAIAIATGEAGSLVATATFTTTGP